MGKTGRWKTAGQWLAEQAARAFFRELARALLWHWLDDGSGQAQSIRHCFRSNTDRN